MPHSTRSEISTTHVRSSITLFTHLKDDLNSHEIQISEHDTVHSLFKKCAAAWPQTFQTVADIKRMAYREDGCMVEICRGSEFDFEDMKKMY
jgi:hypothetical protein